MALNFPPLPAGFFRRKRYSRHLWHKHIIEKGMPAAISCGKRYSCHKPTGDTGSAQRRSVAVMTKRSPWTILGLQPTSDTEEIRQAYLSKVRQHHPDLYQEDSRARMVQEEQMKWINWAYTELMTNPNTAFPESTEERRAPSASGKEETKPPWITCSWHGQPAGTHCSRCHAPLCPACPGFLQQSCAFHLRQASRTKFRRRVMGEWSGLFLIVGWGKLWPWPLPIILWTILGYLAVLGIVELRRFRYFGCLAWLFIPYSLVLAGLYRLYDGLSRWNQEAGNIPD